MLNSTDRVNSIGCRDRATDLPFVAAAVPNVGRMSSEWGMAWRGCRCGDRKGGTVVWTRVVAWIGHERVNSDD
jgi:hypothetical protein